MAYIYLVFFYLLNFYLLMQIYLRESNITPEIEEIIVDVMRLKSIATSTKALIFIIESYPKLTEEIEKLKNELREHIREKHDFATQLERIQRSILNVDRLKKELEEESSKLISLAID